MNKPSKRTRALQNVQEKHRRKWQWMVNRTAAPSEVQDVLMEERLKAHAAGWIDGIRWQKRQQRK